MMYLEGYVQAIQDGIERDVHRRLVVERVPPARAPSPPTVVREAVGRSLVAVGLHLMGDSPRSRRAA